MYSNSKHCFTLKIYAMYDKNCSNANAKVSFDWIPVIRNSISEWEIIKRPKKIAANFG